MSKMSGLHIQMTEDILHNLTYDQFVEKYGQTYAHMYNEIENEYMIEKNYQFEAIL